MNPLVFSLTRPPRPLPPHHHRHRHHQVNRLSVSPQILKKTGVKRRLNTALHMEINGGENGELHLKDKEY